MGDGVSLRTTGTISVRHHCTFRWWSDDGTRIVELDGSQCKECIDAMRKAAHLAGCRMSDERRPDEGSATR